MKRRLITSALPYVNNVPHLGNLIQVLSADAFARFCRLRGYDTLYVCGTDEYGTATENRAAEEGISPRELCDRYYAIHAEIYRWFNINFDKFGRTSTPIQTEVTQDIFKKLDARSFITGHTIEQLHCAHCGRFLADRYVRGFCPHCGYAGARGDQCEACGKLLDPTELKEPRCSSCGAAPSLRETRHLYIDLPRLRNRLEAWIKDASVRGFWANNAVQMTAAWIRDGLRERAITRDLKWGIPVPKPGFEDKVFYVWFDAPIGYISITGNLGDELAKKTGGFSWGGSGRTFRDWREFVDYWWKSPGEVELFQFVGKDNIPFHTVIFPSSLLGSSGSAESSAAGPEGCEWTMLHHMSSTEYLNYESGKFSKSKGIGVFGTDVMETGIPADVWRFYIFYNRPEKADALFTWKDFQEKVNGELIGNLGNLVNRTLSFVTRYYDGKIPCPEGSSPDFWAGVKRYEDEIAAKLERADLRDAFRQIFDLSSFANKTFQDAEPWRMRKEDPPKAEAVIRDLCYVVRDLAVLIEPYMPAAAAKTASFFGLVLGRDLSWKDIGQEGGLKPGIKIRSEVLFSKLEDELVEDLRERYSGSQKERSGAAAAAADKTGTAEIRAVPASPPEKPAPKGPEEIAASFAATLDLRVAEIVKIERHPKADKLYIETLETAAGVTGVPEERVIVSGLVPFYKEEELLGKRIIVAYNLKPAKLRGVESRGMLLAASDYGGEGGAGRVEVLDAAGVPTGTPVKLAGAAAGQPPGEIDIDTFFAIPIAVRDHQVEAGGRALTLLGDPIRTKTVASGEVR
ncbi:MAG: methionine--tRNA ligase [Treponema sp.]|jgi:methionyl-tRNA synthetase|nr:methionine--tRNA ligase [Treponema sp.]